MITEEEERFLLFSALSSNFSHMLFAVRFTALSSSFLTVATALISAATARAAAAAFVST
jgi:hypothetical protein